MSIFDRGNRGNVQNPFTILDASTTGYSNPRMPQAFQGSVSLALNYLFDAIYPDYKGTVATKANLPATASANDFYLVTDDGDGKSAGYVWTVTSSSAAWVKRYDVDWSYEHILADTNTRAGYMYAAKYGISDKDALGNVITGMYAGQRFFGGDATGENLTLTANYYDQTGFIQTDNTIRPTITGVSDLGTSALQFRSGYLSTSLIVSTLTISAGSISDSSGAINFGNNALSTAGNIQAAKFSSGTLSSSAGSIVDTSGNINFGSTALTTNGSITGATGSKLADITFSNGAFSTATAGGFSFNSQNISAVGTLTSSKVSTTEVDSGNLILSGQTLTTNSSTTALILQSGSGGNTTTVQFNSKASLNFDLSVSGVFTCGSSGTSSFAGSLNVGTALNINSLATTGTITSSGQLNLLSSGIVQITGSIQPEATGTRSLGTASLKYNTLYISGGLSDGTNSVSIATLNSLRNMNTGVADKMVLSYQSSTGTWIPESTSGVIDHTTLTNLTLGDAGHSQFAMLSGRYGGQTLFGDTAAAGNLTLSSTANAAKGFVLFSDSAAPSSDAVYSGGWTGVSLGSLSRNFNNMYSKGIHYGLRFDQYAGSVSYPTNSGQSVGRVIWDTAINQLLIDTGSAWAKVGNQKFLSDLVFDGATTTKTVDISSSLADARTSIFQLLDNTNSFEQLFCKMTKNQTTVTITVNPPLPAGSYRLLGFN